MITIVCPICGGNAEIILEELIIKKRFKVDIIVYKELRICNRCKWHRYSAR
jgi:hypothetical protein